MLAGNKINKYMFNSSKYTKIYYNIIKRAFSRSIIGYTEKHHIIPRSIGGNNKRSNIVALTAKEHRLCHLLLTKMVIDPAHRSSMYRAAWFMSNRVLLGVSKGSCYQQLKEEFDKLNRSRVVTNETKQKIRDKRALQTNISNQYLSGKLTESPRKGIPNKKTSDALAGRVITWGEKLSETALTRTKCSCIKCKKVVTVGYNGDRHFLTCLLNR
jgi:hypothetical protein